MRVKLTKTGVSKEMKERVKERMDKLPVSSIRSNRKCHVVPDAARFDPRHSCVRAN